MVKALASVDKDVVKEFTTGVPSKDQCTRLCPSDPCTIDEDSSPLYDSCNPVTGCHAYQFVAKRKDCNDQLFARCTSDKNYTAQFDICLDSTTAN